MKKLNFAVIFTLFLTSFYCSELTGQNYFKANTQSLGTEVDIHFFDDFKEIKIVASKYRLSENILKTVLLVQSDCGKTVRDGLYNFGGVIKNDNLSLFPAFRDNVGMYLKCATRASGIEATGLSMYLLGGISQDTMTELQRFDILFGSSGELFMIQSKAENVYYRLTGKNIRAPQKINQDDIADKNFNFNSHEKSRDNRAEIRSLETKRENNGETSVTVNTHSESEAYTSTKVEISQSTPSLVIQEGIKDISDVVESPQKGTFLFVSNDLYILVDQISKFQIASIKIEKNDSGSPSNGKVIMLDDSRFLLLHPREILEVDVVEGKIDTVFNNVIFPEFIVNMTLLDDNNLIVTSKIYPIDKDGIVSFSKSDKNNRTVYDNSKNCRLHNLDIKTKKIVFVQSIPENISTIFADQNVIYAGTFEPQIIILDNNFTILKKINLPKEFNAPVHSIIPLGNELLILMNIEKNYLSESASGTVLFYSLPNSNFKSLTFDTQTNRKPDDEVGIYVSSNSVKRIINDISSHRIWVNYGLNGLAEISTVDKSITAHTSKYGFVSFFSLNRNKTQFLASVQDVIRPLTNSGELKLYDLKSSTYQEFHRIPPERENYESINKFYGKDGNYYMFGKKPNGVFEIYSSNEIQLKNLVIQLEYLLIPEDTAIFFKIRNDIYYCKIYADLINKVTDTIQISYSDRNYNECLSNYRFIKILPISGKINSNKQNSGKIPEEITHVFIREKGDLIIIGYDFNSKNENSEYKLLKFDSEGQLLFEKSLPFDDCEDFVLSAGGRYLSFGGSKKGKTVLSIIDFNTGSIEFSREFNYFIPLTYSNFDKTRDVLFFLDSESRDIEEVNLYQLDLSEKNPKPFILHPNIQGFKKMAIDMENNLIASDGWGDFGVYKLNNLDRIFSYLVKSFGYGTDLKNEKNGFSIGTSNEFLFFNSKSSNYVIFSVFEGKKSIEIMNNLYFKCGKSVLKNVTFRYNKKGYYASDFEAYFNRPSVVYSGFGGSSKSYIELLDKLEQKRISRAKIVPLDLLLKSEVIVEIVDRAEIKDNTEANFLNLHIRISSKSPISSIHVLINENPIFGKKGLPIIGITNFLDTIFRVSLSEGMNNIGIAAKTRDGIMSQRENITVFSNLKAISNVYFLGIGINKHKQYGYDLSYSVKDIRDLANAFKSKYESKIIIDTLFDQGVTRENIKKLKNRLMQTSPNDVVIISFSGHGVLDSEYNYFLATYDINFDKPSLNGLPYEDLEWLTDSIPARKKLLLVDACHSGEVDKTDMEEIKKQNEGNGAKGIILANKDTPVPVLGMNNSFELMQELFANLTHGTGATVISAAAGTQFAYEKNNLANGVFTYSILELIQSSPEMMLSELKNKVGSRVTELTNSLQKPTSRDETLDFDWRVW
jgi:hypothetical protein